MNPVQTVDILIGRVLTVWLFSSTSGQFPAANVMSGRQKPTGMTLGTSTNTSDAGSTSAKSSDISPEQEYFLYELETTEIGSIGLVLR